MSTPEAAPGAAGSQSLVATLRLLKALQAEPAHAHERAPALAPSLPTGIQSNQKAAAILAKLRLRRPPTNPRSPGPTPMAPGVRRAEHGRTGLSSPRTPAPHANPSACRENPNEPEARRNPGETAPAARPGGSERTFGEVEAHSSPWPPKRRYPMGGREASGGSATVKESASGGAARLDDVARERAAEVAHGAE